MKPLCTTPHAPHSSRHSTQPHTPPLDRFAPSYCHARLTHAALGDCIDTLWSKISSAKDSISTCESARGRIDILTKILSELHGQIEASAQQRCQQRDARACADREMRRALGRSEWMPFNTWLERALHLPKTLKDMDDASTVASSVASETDDDSEDAPPPNPGVWRVRVKQNLDLCEQRDRNYAELKTPRGSTADETSDLFSVVSAHLDQTKKPPEVRSAIKISGSTDMRHCPFGTAKGQPSTFMPLKGNALTTVDGVLLDAEDQLCELCSAVQMDLFRIAHTEAFTHNGNIMEDTLLLILHPLLWCIGMAVHPCIEVIDGRKGMGPEVYICVDGKWYVGYGDLIISIRYPDGLVLVIGAVEMKQTLQAGYPLGQCSAQVFHFMGRQTEGTPHDASIIAEGSPPLCIGEVTNGLASVLLSYVGSTPPDGGDSAVMRLFHLEVSEKRRALQAAMLAMKRSMASVQNVMKRPGQPDLGGVDAAPAPDHNSQPATYATMARRPPEAAGVAVRKEEPQSKTRSGPSKKAAPLKKAPPSEGCRPPVPASRRRDHDPPPGGGRRRQSATPSTAAAGRPVRGSSIGQIVKGGTGASRSGRREGGRNHACGGRPKPQLTDVTNGERTSGVWTITAPAPQIFELVPQVDVGAWAVEVPCGRCERPPLPGVDGAADAGSRTS